MNFSDNVNNKNRKLQKIADKVNQAISYSIYSDNLEQIELFHNSNNNNDNLILTWNFVTVSMLADIERELGYQINVIFPENNKAKTFLPVDKVLVD